MLDTLDATGLSDSTIVVLWGDHGWNLGDSAMWAKHTPVERTVRSPLIISVPGMKKAGAKSDALVESIDLLPTLIDLAKPSFTKTQHKLDGTSLAKLLDNPNGKVKNASLSYWRNGISVRTQTHRLIVTRKENQLSNIELYDSSTQFDPATNLATSHPSVVEKLKSYLPKVD